MTKFKLRNMAIVGVMAMGLAMTAGIQANAAETKVKVGNIEDVDITVDLKNEKIILSKSGENIRSIFYTDTKNAKKTVPTSDKWIKADIVTNKIDEAVIDFSYAAKETVLYIATTPTPKAEDIIAITIPAQPTLTAKYANPIGTINSNTPNSGKGSDKDVFDFTTKVGKTAQPVSVKRIQIKKTAAAEWSDFSTFFNKGVLESLQNKGTTLYARIKPLEDVKLEETNLPSGDKSGETKRYSIVANKEDATDTISSIVRGSASAKIAIKGRANASKVTYDYDKFTIKIGKGLSYQKLSGLTDVVSEGGFKANTVSDPKAANAIINIPQATKDSQTEQYYAVRKEGTDKAIASNINYVTVPAQPLIQDALKADDVTVEVVGKQGENATLTFKRSVATPEAITYQYAVATPSDAENSDGTLKLDKLAWKKATIAKNKANVSINLKYEATSTKAGAFKDGTAIYVRKVSNKKTNTLASTYYKLTQPAEGEFAWKESYQTAKTENSIIALGDLSYTVDTTNEKQVTFNIPLYGNGSKAVAFNKENITIKDVTKGARNATDIKDITGVTVKDGSNGKYLEFVLNLDKADITKLEIKLDTGIVNYESNSVTYNSAAKTYTVTVDNKNPEVDSKTATTLKVGKNGKAGAKIAIKFTEAVTPGAIDLKEATTVKVASGGTLKLSSASFDRTYKTLTIEIEDKLTPDSGELKVVLPSGITDTSLAKNKLVGDIVDNTKGLKITVTK